MSVRPLPCCAVVCSRIGLAGLQSGHPSKISPRRILVLIWMKISFCQSEL